MAIGDSTEKIGLAPILTYSQAQTGRHLLYFYTDRKGLSPALAGLLFFIALILDTVTNSLVGNIAGRADSYG